MARPEDARKTSSEGFEGGVAGLELADLLQLNAQNRFSGCFRIQHDDRLGLIFFREGEIVHAELGDLGGEDAFREILAWRGGRFSVEPNVVAARRTIQKRCEHLLLDAHRVLDERRAHQVPPTSAPAPAPASGAAASLEAVRAVPGVQDAVLLTRDGKRVGPDGYDAEVLAGHTVYLAMVGAELGGLFGAGELRSAAVQGAQRHLLVFAAKAHYLGVFARPDQEIGAVEIAVRNALPKAR